jgi:hypothetical protein
MLEVLFQEILDLSPEFSTTGTPSMAKRQELLGEASKLLGSWGPSITAGTSLEAVDFRVKAGGRQSQVAPVGWVRLYSPLYSPHTTRGFYLVYLFSADGAAVYISLNQGTSEFRSGKWRPRTDPRELETRALTRVQRWTDGTRTSCVRAGQISTSE